MIAVYVFDRTHSTQWLAALGICRWGPNLLLASYGGVLADRYDRVVLVPYRHWPAVMTGMAIVVATGAPVILVLLLSALRRRRWPLQPHRRGADPRGRWRAGLAAANSIFAALENLVIVEDQVSAACSC